MSAFFRFPHTPHLAWLGKGKPRNDKVISPVEAEELLSGEVVVEEKIDGANLGFSVDDHGELRAQNRGAYLSLDAPKGQWKPLRRWLAPRKDALVSALSPDLVLFGEWCYAVHSVRYTRLPDWFLAFDVYDRARGAFWSTARRDELVSGLGLSLVPRIAAGVFEMPQIRAMLGGSKVTDGPAEGLYVRRDEGDECVMRAKLVRAEFVQAIEEHWSRRVMETNGLSGVG